MLERLKMLMQEELLHKKYTAGYSGGQQAIVARQPIFDESGKIWGYELLYRRPRNLEVAEISSGTVATANVIINGFETVRPSLKKTQKVLINFTSDLIETQAIKLLPPETCIAEILEDVQPTSEVLKAVIAIKAAGYTIAVDDYIGQDNLRPFLPLADIVKVDVLGLSSEELASQALRLRDDGNKSVLLAEKVEDEKIATLCRQLGFKLFQGFFYSKPEVMQGRKFSTSQALRMQILSLCIGEDMNMQAVSDAILHDPIITSRFLKFANSAYFGFRSEVTTVHRALTLVGSMTFMQWICVNVLATLENSPVSHEMAFLASHRAKFLECLGKYLAARLQLTPGLSASSLFLTGLFSLLESVMRMPLAEILDGVPLNQAVYDALLGKKSPYSVWLKLMDHYERGEWEKSISLAHTLNLTKKDLSDAYSQALEWSSLFFTAHGNS